MQSLRTPARSALGTVTRARFATPQTRLLTTANTSFILSNKPQQLRAAANTPSALRLSSRINSRRTQSPQPKAFHTSTTNMSVQEIKNLKEFNEAKDKDGVMVLDCFATWCGPCKVIAPKISEFAGKYDKARFYKIDVDEVPDVAQELGVRAMPTIYFFKSGEQLDPVVGANPAAIESGIKKALGE